MSFDEWCWLMMLLFDVVDCSEMLFDDIVWWCYLKRIVEKCCFKKTNEKCCQKILFDDVDWKCWLMILIDDAD